MPHWLKLGALGLLCAAASVHTTAQERRPGLNFAWENSVVEIDINRKQYDYLQPWSKRMKNGQKVGVVIDEKSILTTADELFDRTLVRLQRGGRGKWWIGSVSWIDYQANLALITSPDAAFWTGLTPARLGGAPGENAPLQVVRWREGKLEIRRAEMSQYTVKEAELANVPHVQLEVTSEIQNAGWSELIVSDAQVVGLTTSQSGNTLTATPSTFVRSILEAKAKGTYKGLGYFHFYWQPAENTATLDYVQLPGDPRGVLIIDVPKNPETPDVLQRYDVILNIDGFDIDIQGDYLDPEYGHLLLENLATRYKWAGDTVALKIWRKGKTLDIPYRLPRLNNSQTLVPDVTYDREPEYLIVGGLVFQPLNKGFLRSWGADWKRRAPFRLLYFGNESPSPDRASVIVLSQILPDIYNLGYQELRYLILDEVNGKKISRLDQIRDALNQPNGEFHTLKFMQSDSLRRMVLDAGDKEIEATRRVLQRYRIPKESYFVPGPNNTAVAASTSDAPSR